MNPDQETQCHIVIHTAAAASAAGNLLPVPGLGIAADLTAMTTMAVALASVFGGNISKAVAEALAIAALKDAVLKQPIKTLAKELSKLIPFAGQVVAPTISAGMVEAAGWSIARQMDQGII
jgi:uncharacterized protein (DUF697 family)